jgi:hypothetical protein
MAQLLRRADLIKRWGVNKKLVNQIVSKDSFPRPNLYSGPNNDIPMWHLDKIRDWEMAGQETRVSEKKVESDHDRAMREATNKLMKVIT